MSKDLIRGIHADILVPGDSQGDLDEVVLARHRQFLFAHGIAVASPHQPVTVLRAKPSGDLLTWSKQWFHGITEHG